jgi:hypothetical protein
MTMSSPDVTIVETGDAASSVRHYVDWPAIIAGIVLASAISIVLLTFGSAIGLSFVNFRSGADVAPIWIAIVAAIWLLWVEVSSFMAGGYLTGRLRRRAMDASEHESDVRDGAHGLLVWAGALVLGALLAASGVGSVANALGSAASTATQAASNVAGGAAQGAAQAATGAALTDPNAYFIDALFRQPAAAPEGAATPATAATTPPDAGASATATPAAAEPATPSSGETTTTTPAPAASTPTPSASATSPGASSAPAAQADVNPAALDATRGEVGRIIAQGVVNGGVSDDDKAYLAQLVAENTSMSQDEARARVDTVLQNIDDAKAKAADAAETARKTGVLAAFLIAASLLVAAAGAYWAAMMGGNHRDNSTVIEGLRRF